MMEHTTDRLFWTLSSIIIAALLLTLGVKIFPKATSEVIHPMSGVVQSADKSTSAVDQAISGANADKLDWQTGTNGGVGNVSSGSDDTARDQAINNQLTKQNQALQSYQSQLNDAVNHINDLNTRLVNLQNDKTGANNTKDINDLKSQINDANGQIKNYQSQISSLNDQITQLKNSQQSSDGNNSANSAAIQQLQQQQQNLQNDNDGNTGLIQQLKQQIQGLNTKTSNLDSYQNQLTNASAQIQNLIAQMGKLQASGGDNSTAIADTKNQIAQLAQQINSTNTQMQQQIASNQANNQQIQSQINTTAANGLQYKSYIPAGTDLNSIKEHGVYGLAGTYPGIGNEIWGKLIVYDDPSDGQVERVIYTNSGDMYTNATDWWGSTSWQKFAKVGDVASVQNQLNALSNVAMTNQSHILTSADDLNNINSSGVYAVSGDHPKGSPNYNGNWSIVVVNQTGATGIKSMVWYDWQGNMYFKYFDQNQHDWTKVANSDDINNLQNQFSNTLSATTKAVNVGDMNNLIAPGVYNFLALNAAPNHHIDNLPNNYNPNYDTVLVTQSADSVGQLIYGGDHMYYRQIGINNPWRTDWKELATSNDILNAINIVNTVNGNAQIAQSTANKAEADAQTAIQQAATAQNTANTANNTANNNSNLIQQLQQQIATLQSHDIYNITSINDSTNLSTLTTPGTYIYTAGGAGKGISKLAGADNMADVLTNTRPWAWDDGYASIVVSPQLGTWQTQTLIGANGITMVRTMNNGQNFDTNIDSRDKWHLISGDNTNSVMYKGDVTSTDLNNITETGIYSTQGAPGPNSPSQDWTGTLTVLNNTKGMITQNFTTQDGGAPNNEQSWQRIYAYGSWTQWQRTDGGMQPQILSGSNSLLDPGNNNWADGVYKVNGVSRDTPWNIANRYGILVKHTTYSDVSLTYYDAWWNGIYVNYKTISGWQGWREATN